VAFPPFPSQFHPVLNHLPIVLLPLAALLATLGARHDWAWKASKLVLVLAALGAIATVITGMDWAASMASLGNGGNANASAARAAREATLATHRMLGLATATLSVALAGLMLWKKDTLRTGTWAWLWPTLLWIATVLVLATAWYGGSLVFERPAGFGGTGGRGFGGNGTGGTNSTAAPPP